MCYHLQQNNEEFTRTDGILWDMTVAAVHSSEMPVPQKNMRRGCMNRSNRRRFKAVP